MKIGILTYDFYPPEGGQGRHIYEIYYKRILDMSIDVVFISPRENDIVESKTILKRTTNLGRNALYSFLANFKIGGIIKQEGIDLLNVHCGPGGVFLLRRPDVPVIATCHHTYWQQSRYIKSQFWKRIFIPLEKRTYNLADRVICVSKDSRDVLVREYGVDKKKTVVIPNGVDQKEFHPTGTKKIRKSLLYLGRVDKRKGVDFLIDAIALMTERDDSIKLFICGAGKDLKKLKKAVEARGLRDNITFLGFVGDHEVNEWLNKVECVVVPSIFEGFGITVIEAMSAGTPVIATNVDGIRGIIDEGEDGLLVEYGDAESLARAIANLLEDSKLRKSFSKNGLKKIKGEYRWDHIASRTLKVYKDVSNREE